MSDVCGEKTYASETWSLTIRDEEALGNFERKTLRYFLGGIQVNGSWRRRSNLELYKIYKQPVIVKFVKLQRLKWAGHLARMNEDRCCKKIFLAKPMGNRFRGRLPLRWIESGKRSTYFKGQKLVAISREAGENFWRRPGPTQGFRSTVEKESFKC
ncbi:putative endonuclease-reverse transcriptase [Trichonephila clavipes]|nr:putative endonuclease-reverse transcriptase [Trichonephila clavipes]